MCVYNNVNQSFKEVTSVQKCVATKAFTEKVVKLYGDPRPSRLGDTSSRY